MYRDYSHIVYLTEKDGRPVVRIDRLVDGRRDFYTEIELAQFLRQEKWDAFEAISQLVGKSLCIDSPRFREILKIDDTSDESPVK